MSIPVSFTDQLLNLALWWVCFGWEWLFAQSKIYFIWRAGIPSVQFLGKVSFQDLRECYDCSEFLDLQRGFKLFPWRKCLAETSWWHSWPEGARGPHQLPGYEMVTCSDSKAGEIQQGSHGHSPRPICVFQRWYFGVIQTQREKSGGWQWPPSWLQGQLLGDAAPSGSDVGGGFGAGALVGSSAHGIGEGALSKGSHRVLPNPSHISVSMLKRLPSSTMEARHSQSSCTAQQNTFGEAPAQIAHLWSTIASTTISSLHTSW